jgi:hypothetical protein
MAPPIKPTGNALVNAKTGERKWFPQSMVKDAILSQDWVGQPGDRMYVMDGGEAKVIDAGSALTAFAEMGYEARSEEHIRWEEKDVRLEEKYGDSPVRAAAEAFLRGGSFGGSDWLAVQLGASREGLKEREARTSGWITMPSTILGIAGPAILTGGTSLFAKGAVAGAKTVAGRGAAAVAPTQFSRAARGAMTGEQLAAEAATIEASKGFLRGRTLTEKIARLTPAGAADVAGRNIGRLLVPAGEKIAGGTLIGEGAGAAIGFMAIPGRTIPRTLQAVAESGLYGIGEAISIATLNDDPITAEAIWSESKSMMGYGAVFGGGFSLLLEGGKYLKGFKARRVRAMEELDISEMDAVTRDIIVRKKQWEEQKLAKLAAKKSKEELGRARKVEPALERAERRRVAGLTKEVAAKGRELKAKVIRSVTEAKDLKKVHATAVKDIKIIEAQIEKLGEGIQTDAVKLRKGKAQQRLTAAKGKAAKDKALADQARDKADALSEERARQVGAKKQDLESVSRELETLQKNLVALQDANKKKLNVIGKQLRTAEDHKTALEAMQNKAHAKLEGEKLSVESMQADKALADHKEKITRILKQNLRAKNAAVRAEKILSKEIAEQTIATIGGGSKLTERLAVVRNNAEDWRGMGFRLTGKPGQGKLPVIEEMDPLIQDSAGEIHRAIHAFDYIYTTQQRIGSPNVRRYGQYEQEIRPTLVTEGPRFNRTITIDEEYMAKMADGAGSSYTRYVEVLKDLEEAVRVHQKNVTELADIIGYNKESAIGKSRWPKYLDEAYGGPTQYTALGLMQDVRTAGHGTVTTALNKIGKHGDEVADRADLAASKLDDEAAKISDWQRQLALDTKLSAKEAALRNIVNFEKKLRAADDAVTRSRQEVLDLNDVLKRAPGEVAQSEMDAKMEIAQTYFLKKKALQDELHRMQGMGKINTTKLEQEIDAINKEKAKPTRVSKAEGAVSRADKAGVKDILVKRLADQRRKGNTREDLRVKLAGIVEEEQRLKGAVGDLPGTQEADLAKIRSDRKIIEDQIDNTAEFSTDILEAKDHVARWEAATAEKELKAIAKESDSMFGTIEEGGVGGTKVADDVRPGAPEGRGIAQQAFSAGAGNVGYHAVASKVGGMKGFFLAAIASNIIRRVVGGRQVKRTRKGRIDLDMERSIELRREKGARWIGSFVGIPGKIAEMPAYATSTIGMLDVIDFDGFDVVQLLPGKSLDFSDPKRKPPDSRARLTPAQKAYREKVQQLRSMMANPEALMDRLNDAVRNIRDVSPKVAAEVANNEFRRIMYVVSKIPLTPPVGYAGSDYSEYILPASKIARFARIAYAAYEPSSVLAKLVRGTLTAAEGEAYRNTSPQLFALDQEMLIDMLGDPRARKMSFSKRLQMSFFLGRPADTVLRSIQGRQKIFDEEQQQQQQPQVDLSQVKQSVQNQETNTQRRAAKR